jgi:hypothetical protein
VTRGQLDPQVDHGQAGGSIASTPM